jgi:tetratricopeptide (TPR) repeat protein
MFDISRAVKAKVENLSKENLNLAIQKCMMAKLLLETATETKDNKLIGDAVEEYLQAIEIYSKLPEPYLAIAYISLILGKPEDSIKLLNKVLDIEPHNSKARSMIDQINEEKVTKIRSSIVKKHSDKAINDIINKNNESPKKDIFSKISEMFSIKPKNLSNNLKNSSKKPAVNIGILKKDEDFNTLVQQTRKKMFGNEG